MDKSTTTITVFNCDTKRDRLCTEISAIGVQSQYGHKPSKQSLAAHPGHERV